MTIALPPELEEAVAEEAVAEEASQKGTTIELLTLDILQERFLKHISPKPQSNGATLADTLTDYIGAINTRDRYPEGSKLSESTGRDFAQLMVEKRKQGKL